jgi:hypothetical protein
LHLASRSFVVALVFFASSFLAGFFPRYARLSRLRSFEASFIYHEVFDAFRRVAAASCGDVRFVIPSEVEESLDISDHTAVGEIKRRLDFARHDKRGVPQP